MIKYSLIVPVFNEQEVLPLFYKTVTPIMQNLDGDYEIIFINDGSRDSTKDVLLDFSQKDSRVKICSFSRNFGQQSGIMCGFEFAKGEAIIVIDADLQDPPEIIPKLIDKWREGYDIVHATRNKREGETLFKKLSAFCFCRIMKKMSGLPITIDSGEFKLYSRRAVDNLLSLNEHDRFLRAQSAWIGFKQCEVKFNRMSRAAGKTHWTTKKLIKLAGNGIFPNSDYLLHTPLKLGILSVLLSLVCFVTFIVLSCLKIPFGGLVAWLFPTITMVTGILLISHGISNIYTFMIYKEVQNRPHYIIEETINIEK